MADTILSGDRAAPAAPDYDQYNAATAALDMNKQEQTLYLHHLNNLYGPGGVDNDGSVAKLPKGSRATVGSITEKINGRYYTLPSVYDGKVLTFDDAVARAEKVGLDNFPSYASEQEAEVRYQQMHNYMDRDMAAYYRSQQK